MSTPTYIIDPVLEAVRNEFIYALRWDRDRAQRSAPECEYDRNKPIDSWLVYMRYHLNRALDISGSTTDKRDALDEIRKIANVAATCLAYRGCPPRVNYDQAAHESGRPGFQTDDPTCWFKPES